MITTTLNRIRERHPCEDGWKKLLYNLGKTSADDEPLPFSVILESNGIDDALWATGAAPEHIKEWRLFAVWCARQVPPLLSDECSVAALDVAEKFANGVATWSELDAARGAAIFAARGAARGAAWDTAWRAAMFDDSESVEGAALSAAEAVAKDAMSVHTDWNAAMLAARAAQAKKFLEIVS